MKLARLHALSRKVKLSVCADSLVTVDGLARWFEDPAKRLDVLVECDTGQHRCGVTSPAAALVLARAINDRPGLRFAELLTYPPRGKAEAVNVWLKEARDLCTAAGLPPQVISNGGTPGLNELGELDCVTEYRAGSYIYNDRSLVTKGAVDWSDCALRVAATVVSRPSATLAIIDAGSKILTSDLMGLDGYGHCTEYPGAVLRALNEEHGYLDLLRVDGPGPAIGAVVSIIPNHCCVVSNMVDTVIPHRAGIVEAPIRVAARGRLA